MKKIQILLVAVILMAIAGRVSFLPLPAEKTDYAALSIDTKLENVEQFFRYKVNPIQSGENFRSRNCTIQRAVCCHT